ncbi:MAG: AMP-binding protein [Chloroflexota bacterium]|nr:AMP-binding protein [Chloroflexota bacterium]
MILGETLAHQARIIPNRQALVFGSDRISWGELNARTNRLANALLGLGAQHGDRVLLLLGNSPEFIEAYYALAKIGCISAPVLPGSVAGEVAFIATSLRARFVIAEAASAPLLRELAGSLDTVQAMIGLGPGHNLPYDYHELGSRAGTEEPAATVKPDDLLTVKFTSGTTGTPKGCLRSHRNFVMAALVTNTELPLYDGDSAIIATPLSAGMGISQVTLLIVKGVRIALMAKFEPGAYLELIERERPTLAYLMDVMSHRLHAHPHFASADLSSLRRVHLSGSARDILAHFSQQPTFHADLTSGFASSECGGLVSFQQAEDYRRALSDPSCAHLLDSLGREAPLYQLAILDDDLRPLPAGELGELAVRGPSIFQGYWERPEETAKTLRDGWLLTGDLVRIDEDGYIYWLGRKRDVIRSGGINVYPAEVEPVLRSHPKVSDAAVVGLPDADWGEKVVACVVAREACTEAEIVDWCQSRLAAFKRPKTVVFFDALPVSEAGKITKKEIVRLLTETALS